jgi:hypothetical protein
MGADNHAPDGVPSGTKPDLSLDGETVAIQFSPPDSPANGNSGNSSNNPKESGATNRRRVIVLSGVAVVAIAAVIGAIALGGGDSKSNPTKSSRQESQLGDGTDPTNTASGLPGQVSSELGAGGGAAGSPTAVSSVGTVVGPNSTGGPSGSVGASSTNPSQPSNSTNPSKPGGQPSNPVAPSNSGNQPTGQPSAGAKPATYAGRLASAASKSTSSSTSTTVQTSAGSSNGDTLLISVMLTNTHSGGVGATDSAGNSYTTVADQADGAGDRTLILAAVGARALNGGGSVTVTFPATLEHHVALDDFAGVTGISGHASNTAASGPFNSGSAGGTTGIAFGVAGVQGGENATWSGGFTALPTLFVSADQLATAYGAVGSGAAQASGSCDHQWMAAVVTLAG